MSCSHGSGVSCLYPSESRSFSLSTRRTTALTVCPFLKRSPGCVTRLVQERSETWIRPSIPSSRPTKTPNSVMLLTLPSMRPDRVLRFHHLPRVGRDLLHAERDLPALAFDVKHLGLHLIAHGHQLGGVLDLVRPRHLRDVDESLDSRLQLHERPVVHQADHFTPHPRADGGSLLDVEAGIGLAL